MGSDGSQLIHSPLPSFLIKHFLLPTLPILTIYIYSGDYNKIDEGETVTVEIPSRQWTLVIGWRESANNYTVGVNGVEMSALPEAPMTAASQPEFCKSSELENYSESVKYVGTL